MALAAHAAEHVRLQPGKRRIRGSARIATATRIATAAGNRFQRKNTETVDVGSNESISRIDRAEQRDPVDIVGLVDAQVRCGEAGNHLVAVTDAEHGRLVEDQAVGAEFENRSGNKIGASRKSLRVLDRDRGIGV